MAALTRRRLIFSGDEEASLVYNVQQVTDILGTFIRINRDVIGIKEQ